MNQITRQTIKVGSFYLGTSHRRQVVRYVAAIQGTTIYYEQLGGRPGFQETINAYSFARWCIRELSDEEAAMMVAHRATIAPSAT